MSEGRLTRPAHLTDDDVFNLDIYLMGSLLVKGLTSDDSSQRERSANALKESGLDPDEGLRLHREDHKAAVGYVLRGMVDPSVPDDTLATCAHLLEDDAVFDYMTERMAEDAVRRSGLTINGVEVNEADDDSDSGRG